MGIIERIVGSRAGTITAKNLTGDGSKLAQAIPVNFNRHRGMIAEVDDGNQHIAVMVFTGGNVQIGNLAVCPVCTDESCFCVSFQLASPLVAFEHMEHVIRGRAKHPRPVGKNHGLQHIDRLRNVGHDHRITMVAKDVQIDRGDQGVPHSILLVQEMGVGSFLHIKPCTPFINYKTQIFVGAGLPHPCGVVFNQPLHLKGFIHGNIILFAAELGGRAFVLPFAAGNGVVMQA